MPIIKAIKVIEKDDLNNLDYECDYYLLDSKISGSGKSFDWSLIKDLDKPFFLAGGIDLDNLDEAMSKADYGIDVSSGVETNGIKDRNKNYRNSKENKKWKQVDMEYMGVNIFQKH